MKLIFGLGNFGDKYNHTRHNMGFDTVDILAKRLGIRFDHEKCKGMYAQGFMDGEKIILVKPLTYMNNSGECVSAWIKKCMVTPEDIIVIYDDISLDPGIIRVRPKGSAGGHNGMKNIITLIGTQEFDRVRIGIGDKPEGTDLVEHVLGRFAPKDYEAIDKGLEAAADATVCIIKDGMEKAMNTYNKKPAAKEAPVKKENSGAEATGKKVVGNTVETKEDTGAEATGKETEQ